MKKNISMSFTFREFDEAEELNPDEPVPPCGNCRQVLAEEELRNGKQIRVILSGRKKTLIIDRGSDLLPLQFNKNILKTSPL